MEISGRLKEWSPPMDVRSAPLDNLARVLGTLSFRMHTNSPPPNLVLARVASLNIQFPAFSARFISGSELFGGLLLILELASRLTCLLLGSNMLAAYWMADHDALISVFSDPGRFYVADPYTFLFASLMVLIFGTGALSADTVFVRKVSAWV